MVNLQTIVAPLRLLAVASQAIHAHNISIALFSNPKGFNPTSSLRFSRNMSQKSITSFFSKTPKKSVETQDEQAEHSGKKLSKRQRVASSSSSSSGASNGGSDSDGGPPNTPLQSSAVTSVKKKPVKRQRIDSSSSEELLSKKENVQQITNVESATPNKSVPSPKVKKEISPKIKKKVSPKIVKAASPKIVKEASPKIVKEASTKIVKEASPKIVKKASTKIVKEASTKIVKAASPKIVKEASTKIVKEASPKIEKKDEESDTSKLSTEESRNVKIDEDELVPQVAETEYDPGKSRYHLVRDACWPRGAPVPYLALARTLEAVEATSARLRMINILSNYLRSVLALTPQDLVPSVYLCLNQLAPAAAGLELGVAETYLMKAVGRSTGRTLAQMRAALRAAGDLGAVAQSARCSQRTLQQPPPLQLRQVHAAFLQLAAMSGQSSVDKKIAKIQSLYIACRQTESRYLIRSLSGKLRVGLAEQSVLQALALTVAATPPQPWPPTQLDVAATMNPAAFKALVEEYALIIKSTYCECPNYEAVIPAMLEHGVRALPQHCRLTPGVPLKPMLAQPTRGVQQVLQKFESTEFTCEWKYDGERAQIHVPSREGRADLAAARVFSRNQEDTTGKYPDVVQRLGELLAPDVASCVLDCEAVAYDVDAARILPFQALATRRRKEVAAADVRVQVCVFVFDLLYLNGASLVRAPLAERRALLRRHVREVEGRWLLARSRDAAGADGAEAVQEFLEEAVRGSCEGLMVKTLTGPDATYEIARRSRNWLKLKKDYLEGVGDSIDAVVVGGYRGKGKRAGRYGGFLLACYQPDEEEYQSLCKIGTGFSDEDLRELSAALEPRAEGSPKPYYRYDASHEPDEWFAPWLVVEVRCADLSLSPAHRAAIGLLRPDRGLSLRFPRYVRSRPDKTPEQATTAQQIVDLYLAQDQVKNQPDQHTQLQDDFY